jgi:Mg2+/Co2+ transporter CorB
MGDLTLAWFGLGATVVLLCCSAFFSSAETAIFTLPTAWIDEQATTDDRRAHALKALRDDPHRLLVTVLVGNNVVNVALSSIVTVVFVTYLPTGIAVTAATVAVSVVVLVFGEIVPKSYGLGNAKRWAVTVARPVSLVERTLSPLVTVFDVVTGWISDRLGGENGLEQPYVD